MALSANEKKWQAESDAYTLAQYQEIMEDKARRTAAIKAAKAKADDLTKRATAMQSAAGMKPTKSTAKRKK